MTLRIYLTINMPNRALAIDSKGACWHVVLRLKIQDNVALTAQIGESDHLHAGIR